MPQSRRPSQACPMTKVRRPIILLQTGGPQATPDRTASKRGRALCASNRPQLFKLSEGSMANTSTHSLRTGPLQLDGDWPGVFIRGDDALSFARTIRALHLAANARAKEGAMPHDEVVQWGRLEELMDILNSCRD